MTWPADLGDYALLALAVVAIVHGAVRSAMLIRSAREDAAAAWNAAQRAEMAAKDAKDAVEASVSRLDASNNLIEGAIKRARDLEMDIQEVCKQTGVKRNKIKLG